MIRRFLPIMLKHLLLDVVIALVASTIIYWVWKIFGHPTLRQYRIMTLIILAVFVMDGVIKWILMLVRLKRYPEFMHMMSEGMVASWEEFKRIKGI